MLRHSKANDSIIVPVIGWWAILDWRIIYVLEIRRHNMKMNCVDAFACSTLARNSIADLSLCTRYWRGREWLVQRQTSWASRHGAKRVSGPPPTRICWLHSKSRQSPRLKAIERHYHYSLEAAARFGSLANRSKFTGHFPCSQLLIFSSGRNLVTALNESCRVACHLQWKALWQDRSDYGL